MRPSIILRGTGKPGVWYFTLGLGGFLVNGFRYKQGGAILPPRDKSGRAVVKAYGIHWKRLKRALEEKIAQAAQEREKQACGSS